MQNTKSLHFATYEEAAEWFETHDMTDYGASLIPVEFQSDLRKNRDWVELEHDLASQIRRLAHQKHTSTRVLVNTLLKERLQTVSLKDEVIL